MKSAPAYYGGRLYVGDYGGAMNAVDAKNGELTGRPARSDRDQRRQFYSTPAVAFGRVYAGNNDDRVYSFDLSDGELAWTYSTGGYAYSHQLLPAPCTARRPSTSAPSTATSTR